LLFSFQYYVISVTVICQRGEWQGTTTGALTYFRDGAASLLDFLDAERSYRSTELNYRQALASYLTAQEQLREAVGTRDLQ
jgi:outer membrane protein TolC